MIIRSCPGDLRFGNFLIISDIFDMKNLASYYSLLLKKNLYNNATLTITYPHINVHLYTYLSIRTYLIYKHNRISSFEVH